MKVYTIIYKGNLQPESFAAVQRLKEGKWHILVLPSVTRHICVHDDDIVSITDSEQKEPEFVEPKLFP